MINMSKDTLKASYQQKLDESFSKTSLSLSDISSSLEFFEERDSAYETIVPKKLHTYCIVAGVPFDEDTTNFIENCCFKINKVLKENAVYFVKSENFGLELLMLKWPDDPLPNQKSLLSARRYLKSLEDMDIEVTIEGFQFHTDGCMLLKGYDKDATFRKIRKKGSKMIQDIPIRQSSWCHIPLGRIISEVNETTYMELVDLVQESSTTWSHKFRIKHIKLLEETRWYQEENKLIFQKDFN